MGIQPIFEKGIVVFLWEGNEDNDNYNTGLGKENLPGPGVAVGLADVTSASQTGVWELTCPANSVCPLYGVLRGSGWSGG
jgi:hypothetical protein